jgi:hypothetical protein
MNLGRQNRTKIKAHRSLSRGAPKCMKMFSRHTKAKQNADSHGLNGFSQIGRVRNARCGLSLQHAENNHAPKIGNSL